MRVAPTTLISWVVARGPADAKGGARSLSPGELGVLGEELAARFLRSQGLRLVGRNLTTAEAELDIVGIERQTLVAVEVKTGWWPVSDPGAGSGEWARRRPGARVTEQALARRATAARRLARSEGLSDDRVDVVEVITGRGPAAILVHHRRFGAGSLPPTGSLTGRSTGLARPRISPDD